MTSHSEDSLDVSVARQIGRDDAKAGKPNCPLANDMLHAECVDAPVGTKTHLMRAYNQGWHEQNAAAADEMISRER